VKKWRVSIRARADADLRQARDWYEQQRPGLGDEFLISVADVMLRLEREPKQTAFYYRDFRRLITGRFPYKVFYRVEGNLVIVFRVLHAGRDHARELK
jgi:plasmid stabilization system protein ParE